MGRSVATPRYAAVTVYSNFEADYTDVTESREQWLDYMDQLRSCLQSHFPSLRRPARDKWIDRECNVILENDHAMFTVSEYCGIVAVCVVQREDTFRSDLAEQWIRSVEGNTRLAVKNTFGLVIDPIATASNGETFYRRQA